jgi:hypothetical protein
MRIAKESQLTADGDLLVLRSACDTIVAAGRGAGENALPDTTGQRLGQLKANTSTEIPGRPSGVSSTVKRRSIAASTSQAMTLVALPVITIAAIRAHFAVTAVMMTRVPVMGNASAKVSTISTPLRFKLEEGAAAVSVGKVHPGHRGGGTRMVSADQNNIAK